MKNKPQPPLFKVANPNGKRSEPEKPKNNKWEIIFISVAAVLIVFGVCMFFYFYNQI